tara:strand:- start:12172 stop:13131 length:960 start_codon:yes stop_codon:yes gene_type:complete
MKKKILIIGSDPNSINSEIIYKSWKSLKLKEKNQIYLISNYKLLLKQFEILKYPIKLIKVKDIDDDIETNRLKVINIDIKFKNPFNVSMSNSSIFIKKSFDKAHKIALSGKVVGIINCPLNKKLLKKNQGVTEYLAFKCEIRDNSEVMLIKSKNFAVSPITTHINIKNVVKKISKNLIIKKINTINNWYKKYLKIKPKIGVLGINPHNGEMRKNSEEIRIILPAIKKLKKNGLKVFGPLVADTVFINDYINYDVIVGMYHDQVLTPFKTIYKFDAINLTLGLKYLRLSPDHGVASNIIKKEMADKTSLLKCVEFLKKLK